MARAPKLLSETYMSGRVTAICGDVIAALKSLPANKYDCCVTSPPYWGLRDYGIAGQLGLEPSLGEHLQAMVAVFREVRRVLKPSATLWVNYGDCYATAPNGRSAADTKASGNDDRTFRDKPFSTIGPINRSKRGPGRWGGGNNPIGAIFQRDDSARHRSRIGRSGNLRNGGKNGVGIPLGRVVAGGYLKAGDLCMVPNRIAIALQDDGWWVKAENVWGKPNAMPDSSGVSRPSAGHEKIWLLAKSDRCKLWRARDTGEISAAPDLTERCALRGDATRDGPRWIAMPYFYDAEAVKQDAVYANSGRTSRTKSELAPNRKRNGSDGAPASFRAITESRLLRNYEPAPLGVFEIPTEPFSEAHFATMPIALAQRCIAAGCPPGGEVLDPFGGSGTTAIAALARGCNATIIDLNPEYCTLARSRIEAEFMGPIGGRDHMIRQLGKAEKPGPLFEVLT